MPIHRAPAMAAASLGAIAAEVLSITFETFFSADVNGRPEGADERAALDRGLAISMVGSPSYLLVVAWPATSEAVLCSWFQGGKMGGQEQLTVKEALSEVINIVAGQVKSQLALDHALGLPHTMTATQLQHWRSQNNQDGVWLQPGSSQARMRLTCQTAL